MMGRSRQSDAELRKEMNTERTQGSKERRIEEGREEEKQKGEDKFIYVVHLGRERKMKWREGMKASNVIRELSLTPDICMVVRNGEVITEDERIFPGDRIKIIVALSGGTKKTAEKGEKQRQKEGVSRKSFVDAKTAFGDFLREYDREMWAEFKIFENWKKIGGRRKVNSIRLKDGILRITTYDSTLRNFLTFNKRNVIQKINDILGENMVNDIFVSGVSSPIFRKFSLSGRKKR